MASQFAGDDVVEVDCGLAGQERQYAKAKVAELVGKSSLILPTLRGALQTATSQFQSFANFRWIKGSPTHTRLMCNSSPELVVVC